MVFSSYSAKKQFSRGGTIANYFGTGALGDVHVTTNTTFGSGDDDAACLISHFKSLTVDSGVTISPAGRRRAWVIYVLNDLNLQGLATMNKGAASTATKIVIMRAPIDSIMGHRRILSAIASVPTAGASGAPTQTTLGATNGTAGTNGQTGGGGSGAGDTAGFGAYGNGGAGSAGTAYSGGCGGGGGGYNEDTTGTYVHGSAASANGGAGGAAADSKNTVDYYVSAGGSGNPGGSGDPGVSGTAGKDGTGGVIIFIVGGNVTYGAASFLKANGTAGGDAVNVVSMYAAFGGGGTGGGRVIPLYAGSLSNSGLTSQANGGSGGTATATNSANNGGAGGAGSVTTPTKIDSVSS